MDARQSLGNSIARILKKNKVNFTDNIKNDISSLLEQYEISKDKLPDNGIQAHINLFIAAKRVDGLSTKTLKDYTQQLNRFALSVKKQSE